jgi:hypothetical protein
VPAGTQTTSPSANSTAEEEEEEEDDDDDDEDDLSNNGFIMALLPSLLISILSTRTTIPLPLTATSVWSDA